ncbi:DUF2971 domain-containing protein [Paenibacillus chitinolyticus]|uniref:DUF2971 domain-containing protein n=1 Tax=Paenibacillus chitinolyticus TaxID=79263 RepID=UPI003667084A
MWIDEFVKKLFPIDVRDVKYDEACALLNKNIPSSLYKYKAYNDYALTNLKEDTIWFNKSSALNDPYDCSLTFDISKHAKKRAVDLAIDILVKGYKPEMPEEELKKLYALEYEKVLEFGLSLDHDLSSKPDEIQKFVQFTSALLDRSNSDFLTSLIERSQEGNFLSCFSEINDSILMWSHYTHNHQGFCLEYDFRQTVLERPLSIVPVIYSNQVVDISEYLLYSFQVGDFNGHVFKYAAMNKSTEWSYEKEWRIIVPFALYEGGGFNYSFAPIKAIYLGTKINSKHREEILEIAREKQINVFQMIMKRNEFKLYQEQIL